MDCLWRTGAHDRAQRRGGVGGGEFMRAMTKQGKQDTDMYIILLNNLALKHFSL